jgi:hypothetical protein
MQADVCPKAQGLSKVFSQCPKRKVFQGLHRLPCSSNGPALEIVLAVAMHHQH